MPRPGLRIPRLLGTLPLILMASLSPAPARAGGPKLSHYPLRLHVLAADQTSATRRMSPAEAVACDALDGGYSSLSLDSGGPLPIGGLSGDPCSLNPGIYAGGLMNVRSDDLVYAGEGRADLVSPPAGTQGLSFEYGNCSRVRVLPGFQSLRARWRKPGKQLEVLIPSDDIPVKGRPLPPERCTFAVDLHDFVYLLLRTGAMVQVSQEVYWQRPALRVFLSGMTQTMERRPQNFTVSAHPAH